MNDFTPPYALKLLLRTRVLSHKQVYSSPDFKNGFDEVMLDTLQLGQNAEERDSAALSRMNQPLCMEESKKSLNQYGNNTILEINPKLQN